MFLLAEGIDLLICCLCNCFYKKSKYWTFGRFWKLLKWIKIECYLLSSVKDAQEFIKQYFLIYFFGFWSIGCRDAHRNKNIIKSLSLMPDLDIFNI